MSDSEVKRSASSGSDGESPSTPTSKANRAPIMKSRNKPKLLAAKSSQAAQNVLRRGNVPKSLTKKEQQFPVGPLVLGLFIFVVVGSAVFQIFRNVRFGSTD